MKALLAIIIGLTIIIGLHASGIVTFSWNNEVQATGGAGQIAGKIMSILEDAQTYLNEGDTQAAQKEIQDAINELKDTYEADQK